MEVVPRTSADHKDLTGDDAPILHRRERISTQVLSEVTQCRVRYEDDWLGPYDVLDVSTNGLAFRSTESLVLPVGASIQCLEVTYGEEILWSGPVTCVYQTAERAGVQFASGYLEVDGLKARSRSLNRRMEDALVQWRAETRELSAEWRSGTMAIVELFRLAKSHFEYLENTDLVGVPPNASSERATIEAVHAKWWPTCEAQIVRMHTLTKEIPFEAREIARKFAERQFVPIFMQSPILGRSIEKPRGYAGDFIQMVQYNQRENEGKSTFGRFLHYVAREFPLGKTVVARQHALTTQIAQTYERAERPKIVSLASGPAFEIQWFLRNTKVIHKPIEFVLVDQDPLALSYAQQQLDKVLSEVEGGQRVKISCVNSSVKQILRPSDPAQAAFLIGMLGESDLTYSAGLLDYLPDKVAAPLVTRLFELLDSKGVLLIGNLMETPPSTWIMENGLSWFLVWRDEDSMLRLGDSLRNAVLKTTLDSTGNCVFLEATKV